MPLPLQFLFGCHYQSRLQAPLPRVFALAWTDVKSAGETKILPSFVRTLLQYHRVHRRILLQAQVNPSRQNEVRYGVPWKSRWIRPPMAQDSRGRHRMYNWCCGSYCYVAWPECSVGISMVSSSMLQLGHRFLADGRRWQAPQRPTVLHQTLEEKTDRMFYGRPDKNDEGDELNSPVL